MKNPLSMKGKCILITGASSGIGRSCAQILSQLGAIVRISGRNQNRLKECLASLTGIGHLAFPYSLENFEGIDLWLDSIVNEGKLDGLVHCAGKLLVRPIKAISIADYKSLMNVNIDSAFILAKSFRRRNIHNPNASIVFVSSVAGITGQACHSAYSTSKAALLGLSKSLAAEFISDKIRVNCVLPGYVRSEMYDEMSRTLTSDQIESIEHSHPLGLGKVEDVAFAISYLLSDIARWVTGSNLIIDGGYSAV